LTELTVFAQVMLLAFVTLAKCAPLLVIDLCNVRNFLVFFCISLTRRFQCYWLTIIDDQSAYVFQVLQLRSTYLYLEHASSS
jgi:hypothetical protein